MVERHAALPAVTDLERKRGEERLKERSEIMFTYTESSVAVPL